MLAIAAFVLAVKQGRGGGRSACGGDAMWTLSLNETAALYSSASRAEVVAHFELLTKENSIET